MFTVAIYYLQLPFSQYDYVPNTESYEKSVVVGQASSILGAI